MSKKKKIILAAFLLFLVSSGFAWYNDPGNDSCLTAYSDKEVYHLSPGQEEIWVVYKLQNACGSALTVDTSTYVSNSVQADFDIQQVRKNDTDQNWLTESETLAVSGKGDATMLKPSATAKGKIDGITLPEGTSYLDMIIQVPRTGKKEEFTLVVQDQLSPSNKTVLDPWWDEVAPPDFNMLLYYPFSAGDAADIDHNWSGDSNQTSITGGYLTSPNTNVNLRTRVNKALYYAEDFNFFIRLYWANESAGIYSWLCAQSEEDDPNTGYYNNMHTNNNWLVNNDETNGTIISDMAPTLDAGNWYDFNLSRSPDGYYFAYFQGALSGSGANPDMDFNNCPHFVLRLEGAETRIDEIMIYHDTGIQPPAPASGDVRIHEPDYNASFVDQNVHIQFDINVTGNCDVNIKHSYAGVDDNVIATGTYLGDVNHSVYAILPANYDHNLFIDTNCGSSDANFTIDTVAPTFALDFNYSSLGFVNDANTVSLKMRCNDNLSKDIYYYLTVNGVAELDNNYTADSNQTVGLEKSVSNYSAVLLCEDAAGNQVTDANTFEVYIREFLLINETSGGVFDLDDINGLIAYSPDNNLTYDFKNLGDNNILFVWDADDTIRFELTYNDGSTIDTRNRIFDLSVLDLNIIRVCVPEFFPTFYTHYLLSSQRRKVALKNPYRDCYITGGYTRYAYGTSYINQVALINQQYELTAWDSNNAVITLGLIDGTVESNINVDALEYSIRDYTIDVEGEDIAVSKSYANTLQFNYYNVDRDSVSTTIVLHDESKQLWTHTNTLSPNEFTVYFDHTTVDINGDLLRIVVTTTNSEGDTESFTKYFTLSGWSGELSPELAIILAFIFVVFALTFVAYKFAMGWFGIIACMVGIALLTAAPPVWYIIFAQATLAIIIVYIILIYRSETVRVS